jgi:hypothetical protein
MNLQEQISRIQEMMDLNKSESKDLSKLIKKILEINLLPYHKNVLCKVEVVHPDKREVLEGQKKYEHYGIYLYVIGGYGTKYFPQTMAVHDMYEHLMGKAWDIVYDNFVLPTDVYRKMIKKCEDN